jgi:DNA topoisomerase-1
MGFSVLDAQGRVVRDEAELARIRSLAIPPAWTKVWICSSCNGHLQAIGFDARGRRQYRYHPRYREVRNQTKFERMPEFAKCLPTIRRQVSEDLTKPGLSRDKVLATVVRLLETTYIRIGNAEYAKENESFGLTTLRNRHVEIEGSTVRFRFRGKSGVDHEVEMKDRRISKIIKQCQDLPGCDLFEYLDDEGAVRTIASDDVNAYLKSITGSDFTAKDFRTWSGTVQTALMLAEIGPCESETEGKRNVVAAIKSTAKRLGNRPATCRNYYVHPAVLEAYMAGSLGWNIQPSEAARANEDSLHPEEMAVLRLIDAVTKQILKAA